MSPVKEPCFFGADLLARRRRVARASAEALRGKMKWLRSQPYNLGIDNWEHYLELFKNAVEETAVGEASAEYLSSSVAPGAIRARIPDARIIMMLRDPVERLFSNYANAAASGYARTDFQTWVAEQQANEAAWQPRLGSVWQGFYGRHLQSWREYFPPTQIRVYMYEEYAVAPLKVLRDLFAFLEVDPDFPVDVSQRYNVTLQPRFARLWEWSAPLRRRIRPALPDRFVKQVMPVAFRRPPSITQRERAQVLQIYEADIRALERLLPADLSAWLRV